MVVAAGRENSWSAAVLSFFMQGLGQMYVGKTKKGFLVFVTGYSLIAIDYILLALSVTSHHPELGFFQRLTSPGLTPLFMLFPPFWIYLLLYGFMVWYDGLPLFFTAPAEHNALILLITALWTCQILDAYKRSKRIVH